MSGIWLLATPAICDPETSDQLCDIASRNASAVSGVPLDILRAVSRVESGKQTSSGLVPWPWAVNSDGKGHWFISELEAIGFLSGLVRVGETNFDLGCFQLNFKWHGHSFDSLEEMLEPANNARYAAAFLEKLYEEFGDWSAAVAAYHSRNPGPSAKYLNRYYDIINTLPGDAGRRTSPETLLALGILPNLESSSASRPLSTGKTGGLGSLVPLQSPEANRANFFSY